MPRVDGRTKVGDEEILDQIRASDDPAITTRELSDQLGITPQAVNYRLRRLEDDGRVDRKRAGSADVWWTTD